MTVVRLAAVILVNTGGEILLQLRDGQAPRFPNVWGLPGGHVEAGEGFAEAALRELDEETGLQPAGQLQLFRVQELPEYERVKHYFYGQTDAVQADVVLGEGAAMEFTPVHRVLDGRPYTPGTVEVLEQFLTWSKSAAG